MYIYKTHMYIYIMECMIVILYSLGLIQVKSAGMRDILHMFHLILGDSWL